jgi:hypothetical protein
MRRAALLLFALGAAVFGVSGCGGYGSSNGGGGIAVTISPKNVIVPVGLTAQFTGSVSGTSNQQIDWQVNNVSGGNSTVGTIDTKGLYTAPASVPNPTQVMVSAVAKADNKTSDSATVTIVSGTVMTVSPAAVSLPAGASQQFSAAIEGVPTTQVTWQVNHVTGGNDVAGRITTQGNYTAPLSPPPSGSVTITALDQNNPATSGSATVTITFSNASLQGGYAFSFAGTNLNGFFTSAGSFQADGNGHLTSGLEDVNAASGVFKGLAVTGTYSVNPDGRGTAQIVTTRGATNLRFALVNHQHAFVIEFDTGANATGAIDLQDPNSFSQSAITGNYAFNFSGIDTFGNPLAFGGSFFASGGSFQNGAGDLNDFGTVNSNVLLNGTYSGVDVNGRGTATISSGATTFNFTFYVVNAGDLKFIEVDGSPVTSGEMLAQPSAVTTASLAGSYSFTVGGASSAGPLAAGGVFTVLADGTISTGVEDFNVNGSITQNSALSGSLSAISNGRGVATLNTSLGTFIFALYPATNGVVELLEIDSGVVSNGAANLQQITSLSPASIKGSYAVTLDGQASTGQVDAVAQLTADGVSKWQGTIDINHAGSLSSALQASGTYSVSPNGRGSATIATTSGTRHVMIYAASPSTVLFIGVDNSEVIVGQLSNQF